MGSTKHQINYTANNFWTFCFIFPTFVYTQMLLRRRYGHVGCTCLPCSYCRCLVAAACLCWQYVNSTWKNRATIPWFYFYFWSRLNFGAFLFWNEYCMKMAQYINFSISKIIFNFHKHTQINMRNTNNG